MFPFATFTVRYRSVTSFTRAPLRRTFTLRSLRSCSYVDLRSIAVRAPTCTTFGYHWVGYVYGRSLRLRYHVTLRASYLTAADIPLLPFTFTVLTLGCHRIPTDTPQFLVRVDSAFWIPALASRSFRFHGCSFVTRYAFSFAVIVRLICYDTFTLVTLGRSAFTARLRFVVLVRVTGLDLPRSSHPLRAPHTRCYRYVLPAICSVYVVRTAPTRFPTTAVRLHTHAHTRICATRTLHTCTTRTIAFATPTAHVTRTHATSHLRPLRFLSTRCFIAGLLRYTFVLVYARATHVPGALRLFLYRYAHTLFHRCHIRLFHYRVTCLRWIFCHVVAFFRFLRSHTVYTPPPAFYVAVLHLYHRTPVPFTHAHHTTCRIYLTVTHTTPRTPLPLPLVTR